MSLAGRWLFQGRLEVAALSAWGSGTSERRTSVPQEALDGPGVAGRVGEVYRGLACEQNQIKKRPLAVPNGSGHVSL